MEQASSKLRGRPYLAGTWGWGEGQCRGGHAFSLQVQMVLSGERMLLGSVSSQQRFGAMDIKALSASQLLGLGLTVL